MARFSFVTLLFAAVASAIECPGGVYIIASPGHSSPPNTTGGLASSISLIEQNIPDSILIRTPYHNNVSASGDLHELGPGQKVLEKTIKEFVHACPSNPYVLLGYSEGGCITMDTLCGASSKKLNKTDPIDRSYTTNLIASIVYGEETYSPFQPYDLGTCNRTGTIPRQNDAGCDPLEPLMQSYCDLGDPLCCEGGGHILDHYKYPDEYDQDLLKFVVQQYNSFRADHPSSTTTYSSITISPTTVTTTTYSSTTLATTTSSATTTPTTTSSNTTS